MPVVIGEGAQAGLTVDAMVQQAADNWGGNPSRPRFANVVKRRVNQALGHMWRRNPALQHFKVFNAECNLIAGTHIYDVRATAEDGGFGWTSCYKVLQLVMPELDQRPLERLNDEQYRHRSDLVETTGPAESWFPIQPWKIFIYPSPAAAQAGNGDYLAEIPSIVDGTSQLDWPRGYDYVVGLGVDWLFARIRKPDGVASTYRDEFYAAIDDIIETDLTHPARPQRAVATRSYRSRRYAPHDNSTDFRR